jgi:cell division protein FtsB
MLTMPLRTRPGAGRTASASAPLDAVSAESLPRASPAGAGPDAPARPGRRPRLGPGRTGTASRGGRAAAATAPGASGRVASPTTADRTTADRTTADRTTADRTTGRTKAGRTTTADRTARSRTTTGRTTTAARTAPGRTTTGRITGNQIAAGQGTADAARQAVPARRLGGSRTPFVLLILGLLGGGLVCLLVINTTLSAASYQINTLQQGNAQLSQQQQALQQQIATDEAPATIAKLAKKLGMVPEQRLSFVNARTGRVSTQPAVLRGVPDVPGFTP